MLPGFPSTVSLVRKRCVTLVTSGERCSGYGFPWDLRDNLIFGVTVVLSFLYRKKSRSSHSERVTGLLSTILCYGKVVGPIWEESTTVGKLKVYKSRIRYLVLKTILNSRECLISSTSCLCIGIIPLSKCPLTKFFPFKPCFKFRFRVETVSHGCTEDRSVWSWGSESQGWTPPLR